MKLTIKQLVQVVLSLLLAICIFWFLYKDIKTERLIEALREASLFWIVVSVLISIWGYWLRAWRWKMLIIPDEKRQMNTSKVFWALMIGYLVNLIVPRAGEVARCGVLKKTDKLPMGKLLGTVILERSIDFLFLVTIILLAFLTENRVFVELIGNLVSIEHLKSALAEYYPVLLLILLIIGIIIYWGFYRYRDTTAIKKLRHFITDFLEGIKSLAFVKNQAGFWASSIMIWVIYFVMMYTVAMAIPSTHGLSGTAVLMVMVMGSIGMIAPVQGGIGTFHALVAFILLFYGLNEEEGKIFAVIIHSTQLLTVIVLGLISLFVFLKLQTKEEPISATLR